MGNEHLQNNCQYSRMEKYVVYLTVALLMTVVSCEKRLVLHNDQDIITRFTAMETQITQLTNRLTHVEQENNLLKNAQANTSVISLHLLELETKNSQLETKNAEFESRLKLVEQENVNLKNFQGNSSFMYLHVAELETKNSQLEKRLIQMENDYGHILDIKGGSVYVRWGKRSCDGNGTGLVYKGYAAGNKYTNTGGGVNTLCLPEDPTWNKYTYSGAVGYVYGSELDSANPQNLVGNYYNQDIPCALCQTDRSKVVMIPGRTNCYPGWTQEYTGYLLSGFSSHSSNTDFICLDENPDAVSHGLSDDDEHVLYFVKTTCSSLSCPPYIDDRVLACVVCSK